MSPNDPTRDELSALLDSGVGLSRLEEQLARPDADPQIVGADGGFGGFLLAALGRRLSRPLVVITADEQRARVLHAALSGWHGGGDAAVLLHAPDTSLYREIAPSRFLGLERLAALYRLGQGLGVRYAVVPAASLLRRTVPPERLRALSIPLERGALIDRDSLMTCLSEAGYANVPLVEDPGTFAVRGGIVDVFSPLHDEPLRIDLFGDEIDEIRTFDPLTQRSGPSIERALLPPASEILLTPSAIERARAGVRRLADEIGWPSKRLRALQDDLQSGVMGPSLLALLPLFHERLATLEEHLPADSVVVVDDLERVRERIRELRDEMEHEHALARGKQALVMAPADLLADDAAIDRILERRPRVRLAPFVLGDDDSALRVYPQTNGDVAGELSRARGQDQALAPLVERIRGWRRDKSTVAIACHGIGAAQRMQSMLRAYGVRSALHDRSMRVADIEAARKEPADVQLFTESVGEGFRFAPLGVVVLDEAEVLGDKLRAKPPKKSPLPAALISSFQELEPGDFIVHVDHGIGRYDGLVRLDIDGVPGDFLLLVYKDENKLYQPVSRLNRISRFVGAEGEPPSLDKLGGVAWERTKARVRRDLLVMAGELVRIYAARAAREGHRFSPPDEYFREFEATFPYEETPDQEKAIDDVLADMQRERPMDRLVCGDVGYGKTEVAIRAAMKAALDGKQVAILVPTTVLAEQHLVTFERRFSGYPVIVESLSRFKGAAEQKQVIALLKEGRVDVVIGTHRLLQKDVKFKDLGLLVVDEEQRFGVRHKERIKEMRTQIDVLTLTATPIPRTLHLSLMGIRDLSVIATPPRDRLSIRTIVERDTDDVITYALERELARGGQVYFLHNRVETIGRRAEHIQRLVPHARLAIGHGQMHKGELEQVMRRFVAGEVNVLVCTTIIESGLDIPNANTLVVDRADRFGLAELYQLRGRVGRSAQRAFAYLLIPDPTKLTGDAGRRIAVLQRYSDLGAGFQIATHDLEIRGAGNMLGAEQHGQIDAVGYDLYLEMLEEAVAELRGEAAAVHIDTELRVPVPALIPETYCPDVGQRLMFYKRFASARTAAESDDALRELADRCGRAPVEVENLAMLTRLKLRAQRLGVERLEFARGGLSLRLHPQGPVPTEVLLRFLARSGNRWRLTPEMALLRSVTEGEWGRGLDTVWEALSELANFVGDAGVALEAG